MKTLRANKFFFGIGIVATIFLFFVFVVFSNIARAATIIEDDDAAVAILHRIDDLPIDDVELDVQYIDMIEDEVEPNAAEDLDIDSNKIAEGEVISPDDISVVIEEPVIEVIA